jgi:Ca-activated chloride channel family protein
MEIDFGAFHFLRPAWLLLLPLAALLSLAWRTLAEGQGQFRGVIAEHLLRHLIVTPKGSTGVQPIHLIVATLFVGALAVAGPTWEQDKPAFLDNRAPLILAVDLSASMNSRDIAPSRLQAAKHKLHDLINRRHGTRIGLIAYAGSAHMVLPATDDPALLDSFLQVLSGDLIAAQGKDLSGVLVVATSMLAAEGSPGTLVLVTDGADLSQLDEVRKTLDQQPAGRELQLVILAVNSQADARLRRLADTTDAPLGSLTVNDDDLDWVQAHAQAHFVKASPEQQGLEWKDAGYWLVYPLLILGFFSLRRGWSLNWHALILVTIAGALPGQNVQASDLSDAFLTADQQGRWAYEHQHYQKAYDLFQDPYWKGLAAYALGDYASAQVSFARRDDARGYFYQGNSYAHLFKFDEAIAAYTEALARQPDFIEAKANLALSLALKKDFESAQDNAPQVKPDQTRYDGKPDRGKSQTIQNAAASSDQQWLQNLNTSPARFLQQKFSLEDARRDDAKPVKP